MKKTIITFSALLILMMSSASASVADLFYIDDNHFYNEMASLTVLDEYVNQNEGITFSSIDATVFAELNLSSGIMNVMSFFGEPPLGIPSFLWGCVLGPFGILLTHLIAEDRDETKKALIGCLVGTGSYIALYIVFFLVIFASTAAI
jgi:hypothetical protein